MRSSVPEKSAASSKNRLAGKKVVLILSGGIDPANGHSEPKVMRERAIGAGVPEVAVVLDEEGVNTVASVRNTRRLMRERDFDSVLAVSHYYHLPRVKMLLRREGVQSYTVPAQMSRALTKEPLFVAREIAAFYNSFLFQLPESAGTD